MEFGKDYESEAHRIIQRVDACITALESARLINIDEFVDEIKKYEKTAIAV